MHFIIFQGRHILFFERQNISPKFWSEEVVVVLFVFDRNDVFNLLFERFVFENRSFAFQCFRFIRRFYLKEKSDKSIEQSFFLGSFDSRSIDHR